MKGWIAMTEREPNVTNPVCYFPPGAFGMGGTAHVSTIQWPGQWKKRGNGLGFTHWRTVESLTPSAASHASPTEEK